MCAVHVGLDTILQSVKNNRRSGQCLGIKYVAASTHFGNRGCHAKFQILLVWNRGWHAKFRFQPLILDPSGANVGTVDW